MKTDVQARHAPAEDSPRGPINVGVVSSEPGGAQNKGQVRGLDEVESYFFMMVVY